MDIGAQFYMISKGINELTKHKARCITIAKNYLDHPFDVWLGEYVSRTKGTHCIVSEEQKEGALLQAKEILKDSDFFIYRRAYFLTKFTPPLKQNNNMMVTYGSEARENPGPFYYLSEKRGVMHVTSLDYSYSSLVGFSAQHIPISIDTSLLPKQKIMDKVRIAHAPTVRAKKLTDTFIKVAKSLRFVKLVLIENTPWIECLKIKATCDISFDQIYLGCYGMSSVESMAMGQASLAYLSGWTLSMYPDVPIVNVTKNTLKSKLYNLVSNRKRIEEIGQQGKEYVDRFHTLKATVPRWIHLIKFVKEERR